MILVLAEPVDLHADAVIDKLRTSGVAVKRLHPASLVEAQGFTFEHRIGNTPTSACSINDGKHRIEAHSVTAVFCRSFDFPSVASTTDFDACLRWEETRAWAHAFFTAIPASRWIDPPDLQARFDNKLVQCQLATRFGLAIPETLASNQPDALDDFIARHPSVIKQLSDVGYVQNDREGLGFFTETITREQLADPAFSALACPVLLQEMIDKAFDVRLTVANGRLFAAALFADARDGLGQIDVRRAMNAQTRVVDIPLDIASKIEAMMVYTGLRYAAFDFGVDRDGRWIFFEFNVTGNWFWIEDATGLPITDALVSALVEV